MLSHIGIDVMYVVNDSKYILKDIDGKKFKVNKDEYNKLIKEGEEAFINTWSD